MPQIDSYASANSSPIRVDLYKNGSYADADDRYDITPLVRNVTWRDSTTAPFSTISLMLKFGFDGLTSFLRPHPGDHIVIRTRYERKPGKSNSAAEPATAWGIVSDVSDSHQTSQTNGAVYTSGTQVTCEGWFDYLGRTRIFAVPGIASRDPVLALMGTGDWNRITKSYREALLSDVGFTLQALVKALPMPRLPSSLGGSSIQSIVQVIHNKSQRDKYCGTPQYERNGAPLREYMEVHGPNIRALATIAGVAGPTLQELLIGTFIGDGQLIEMFPSLEDRGSSNRNGGGAPGTSNDRNANERRTPRNSLGRNPVLMYRICPWIKTPLQTYAANQLKRGCGWDYSIDPGIFPRTTWKPNTSAIVKLDNIVSISYGQSSDLRCNCVIVDLPGMSDTPVRFFERLGLPISKTSGANGIARRGLFSREFQWPFLTQSTDKKDLVRVARTVAALGAQFYLAGDRFLTGTAECAYSPHVRHGEIVRFEIVPGVMEDGYEGYLTAYVTSVEHSVSVSSSGSVTKRTSIMYTRGLFTEAARVSVGDGADETPVQDGPGARNTGGDDSRNRNRRNRSKRRRGRRNSSAQPALQYTGGIDAELKKKKKSETRGPGQP